MKSTPRSIPNIVRAMDGIFEPWFRGDSWSGWKSVLKATAGLEMSDDEIAFFKSIAGGREPPRKRPREAWIIGGRRGGKDSAISLIAAHAAATFNPKGILRPGERAVVICTAPDRDTERDADEGADADRDRRLPGDDPRELPAREAERLQQREVVPAAAY